MQPYPPNRPPQPPPPRAPGRTVTRRPSSGRKPNLLKASVIAVFGLFAAVAMLGFVGVVGGAFVYSQGLKHPSELKTIVLPQDTIIYDRNDRPLARLTVGGESRRTIGWGDVPPILADAVTAIEDKTFWANTGIDPIGILSAAVDTLTGDARGGSTITQQLVRQKLLPDEVVQGDRLGDRKIKEILQSVRVTDFYRGEEGKQDIMTAYLNQNFYGNNSYGVRAAAKSYFDENNLRNLSLSEVATLAAIPQAPSTYDLVRNAVEDDEGNLYVPADSPIVRRRNLVLDLLASDPSRRVISGTEFQTADFEAAKDDVLYVAPQSGSQWLAPHFVWYAREEMRELLCGEAETCDPLKRGGLRVTTTLDYQNVQKKAEKWVEAAALVPHRDNPAAAAKSLGVPYTDWMARLRNQNVWNAALSAIDYETGEIIAYVGSANYYERTKVSKKMQPQFDVLSDGWRQPGSAFKPFTYATGIDEKTLTGATMLMDVTTNFGGYTPTDFNGRERGPLRVRNALQFSLNVPAVKALALVGENDVFDRSQAFGMEFQRNRPTAGLAMALGSLEVHPLDLNQSYATMANGGRNVGRTSILEIRDAQNNVIYKHEPPKAQKVISEQAAYVITDILAGNTDPAVNPIWAENRISAGNGQRRPAALKTGTTNDAKDLNAYGYVAPPTAQGRKNGEYALSVGVWAGNSNASPVTTVANPVFSLDVAAPVWDAFLTDVTRSWEVRDFRRPGGISSASVDAWTGAKPSAYSRRQVTELFIDGTSPVDDAFLRPVEVLKASNGKLYEWDASCEGEPTTRGYLVLDDAESHTKSWNNAVRGWINRARKGVGVGANVSSTKRTATAYFFEPYYQPYGASWGGPFSPKRSCSKAPGQSPSPSPEASLSPSPSVEPSGSPDLSPEPTTPPTAETTPKPTKTPEPTPKPTPKPTPAPTAPPTPAPTPPPTPNPTVNPQASASPSVSPTIEPAAVEPAEASPA